MTNLFYSECRYRRCNSKRDSIHKFRCEAQFAVCCGRPFTGLCKQMFPYSKITKKLSCGRTKTTTIIKKVIAPALEEELEKQWKTGPFSFGCDASNDIIQQKTQAIVVKYCTQVRERAVTDFLDIPICNIGTVQSIFDQLDATFEAKGIPLKNVVAFISNICNTMVGKKTLQYLTWAVCATWPISLQ